MKFRSTAREIALLAASYLDRQVGALHKEHFDTILMYAVKILIDEAKESLKDIKSSLGETHEYLENYQLNHQDNLILPVDSDIISVTSHGSKEIIGHVSNAVANCENMLAALELFEICSISQKDEVKEYTYRILQTYKENEDYIKKTIKTYSIDWNVSRIYKTDRLILSIAITEILLFSDIPDAVAIDEAVVLAARYSSQESKSFINGILGKIAREKTTILNNYTKV